MPHPADARDRRESPGPGTRDPSTESTAVILIRLVAALAAAALGLLLLLPLLLVGLPFWGAALLTRLVRAIQARGERRAIAWEQLIQYEPVVGWRPRPGMRVRVMSDRTFHVSTDAEGWRGATPLDEAQVVVFGDSFAFGTGVDDHAFFADRNPALKVKAVGANGYSMVQGLYWMERLADRLAGKLAVWFVYYGNDLFDNLNPNLLGYRMPFVRTAPHGRGDWEIVTHHVRPDPWPIRPSRRYYDILAEICSGGYLSERAFAACEFLIGRARDVCAEAGSRLVVVGIPDPTQLDPREASRLAARSPRPEAFDPALPDHRLHEICHALDVPFVTMRDYLSRSDYKRNDCHWNERGHRRVARLLGVLHERFAPSVHERRPALTLSTGTR
jgi:hypothetical protein